MEKYTKFDDPSCGLNPFTPLPIKDDRSAFVKFLRSLCTVILLIIRLPVGPMGFLAWSFCNVVKYLLLLTPVIRWFESFFNGVVGHILLNCTSYSFITTVYHREHKSYDFVKVQKGELVFKMEPGEVYVCNQTCFVDWLYLWQQFSPTFTRIVIIKRKDASVKVGLRVLGTLECMAAAFGI